MALNGFCIHGHFYQPPREDPLTGEIPYETGASPFRNWNERIHDQCYRPNAALGNFRHISFNIGPTLVDWMAHYDAETMRLIVEQERSNQEQNQVGNGMAQAYNHTILPLASRLDKITQIRWGLADFEHRFGHKPEGMWLPEAGVDNETLEILVDNGIRFVILAPWQADDTHLDTNQTYKTELQNGKDLSVLFYNQELSTRISFDPPSTVNADEFVQKYLVQQYRVKTGKLTLAPQIVLAASDGELYGHHQPFRDKFLSYLFTGSLRGQSLEPTYPALWLKKYPPTRSIGIRPFTSWSCHHGVTRWMGPCGCTPHGEWKTAFRQACNEIARALDDQYEQALAPLFADPWEVRHQYIHAVLGEVKVDEWLQALAAVKLTPDQMKQTLLLLAAQFERQRVFTSCGFYFEDYDRIEPRNNTAYAAQAVWLNFLATGNDLTSLAMAWLRPVKSWRSALRGDVVFSQYFQRIRSGGNKMRYPRLENHRFAAADNNLFT